MFVQCNLQKGNVTEVSWIPERYAVIGKFLKIKNNKGEWEDGWQVTATFGKRLETEVIAASQFYRHHREATDI